MKDSSNNEQTIKGYFTVMGLDVSVKLIEKRPYPTGDIAEFDITVKNLETGALLTHNSTLYLVEIESNGKLYDTTTAVIAENSDTTKTSLLTFLVPNFADGNYFLKIKATNGGKVGKGTEFIEISNTEIYAELSDNFGNYRNQFKPGELAKITVSSNVNLSYVNLSVYDKGNNIKSTANATASAAGASITFNVPVAQDGYYAELTIITQSGSSVKRQVWFTVQNYFSFLDVKDLNNNHRFVNQQGSEFLAEINVVDITSGQNVDVSSFTFKINKIVNEETNAEYTNFKATRNTTYTDASTGRVTYNVIPPSLPNGIYRIEYTIVNTLGESFSGNGWFGISAFGVTVSTYDSTGQQKRGFAAGSNINVSVTLSNSYNGTATIVREFFSDVTFNVLNGNGSAVLNASSGQIPSQSGFYGFGVEVENTDGNKGYGEGFFEIKSLNFKSITARSNAKFASNALIIADIVMEKAGELVNETNATLSRLVRQRDGAALSASSLSSLSDSFGRSTINITASSLEKGFYFAELKAVKGTDTTYGGFGFEVVEDKVSITLSDTDRIFSQTENIEISVLVTYQNDTPKNNVTVNLTSFLNFNTWSTVAVNKQATTSTSGVATFSVSAANYNPARYAPVINIPGMANAIVGFGNSEFEVKPFSTTIVFSEGKDYFDTDDTITINVSVTGSVTVSAVVTDKAGNAVNVDYSYSNNVLTLNNDLDPGEYFVEVTITQSTSTVSKTLWFQVISPEIHLQPLPNPNYQETDTINFDYTVFTISSNGWALANATVNITAIKNLWQGTEEEVGVLFNATEEDSYAFDLTSYALEKGDYLLVFEVIGNPNFENTLYFRISKDVSFSASSNVASNNVSINVTTTGFGSPQILLEGYTNFESFTYTLVGGTPVSAANALLSLNGLSNGFYQANIKVTDGAENYYFNTFFDVRVKDVTIDAPGEAFVGEPVQFNITATSAGVFWVIDPFTQNIVQKTQVSPGYTELNVTFNYPTHYIYSSGVDKWEAFRNGEDINIRNVGFDVVWPYMNNRYILTGATNFTFNVSSGKYNTPMTLKLKNHFSGNTKTLSTLMTAPNSDWKEFSYDLDDAVEGLGLSNGPHDVELTLEDGSAQPPKMYFFIDIFPDQYNMWAWTDRWEYRTGEQMTINIDIFDILSGWQKQSPDNVSLESLYDSFRQPVSGSLGWTQGNNFANLTIGSSWVTGNYHAELKLNKSDVLRTVPFDFYVRGNDNLKLFWQQNKWDYSSTETYQISIDARDKGLAAVGVPVTLVGFEMRPENWNDTPTPVEINGAYNFSNNNVTDATGRITFRLNISQAQLGSGGYSARVNVGGQLVWLDFNVRTYQVDAYPEEWEYGITDTIEINARARNIDTFAPINENGNVTIIKIRRHEQGNWMPQDIPLESFGIYDASTDVFNGEALIEMSANQTALALEKAYDFELELLMNLTGSGVSKGYVWFKLSNSDKPAATIVDNTGSEPDAYFAGQNYTLRVTGATSATLRNMWGPQSMNYNKALVNNSGTLQTDFYSPQSPGMYTLEIEIRRSEGFPEFIYQDFQIGGDTQLDLWLEESSVVPEVNFTVGLFLMGKGTDPFCNPEYGCNRPMDNWFGPLGNKTVRLTAIKDLDTFTLINKTNLNIAATTSDFPDWMLVANTPGEGCGGFDTEQNCTDEGCSWIVDGYCEPKFDGCIYGDTNTCQNVHGSDCVWNIDHCQPKMSGNCQYGDSGTCESVDHAADCQWIEQDGHCEGEYDTSQDNQGQFISQGEEPGRATFNLHPTILNLTAGKSYDIIFSYISDDGEETEGKLAIQVEKFHVAISRGEENLAANTLQYVWMKTANLYGAPIANCTISFSALYSAKDYKLVKTLSISGNSSTEGNYIFTYTTPSLPGEYLVEGQVTCTVDSVPVTQKIAYFVDVSAKNLEVDMKTRFKENENIKILITTKDRMGNAIPQRLDINLYHDREDYPAPIYSLGGSDCTVLDANQAWDLRTEQVSETNNRMEISTDETGKLELELCAMPNGAYMIDIFPLLDFAMMDEGPKTEGKGDNFGFFSDFMVGPGEVIITTNLTYMVGDTVVLNISATDDNNNPLNGTLVASESIQEIYSQNGETDILVHQNDSIDLSLTGGSILLQYVIPPNGTYEENDSVVMDIRAAPVDGSIMLEDNLGEKYSFNNLLYTIKNSRISELSVSQSVKANKLINVSVRTENTNRYKVEFGIFFLKDNTNKEKSWKVQGGVFLANVSGQNYSEGVFQVLSPKEPGTYYLAIPIYALGTPMDDIATATELLIAPVEVTLDLANVSGILTELDGSTAIQSALVRIGKKEVYTNSTGGFEMLVPKGKASIEIERKVNGELKQTMKTLEYDFVNDTVVDVNFYGFLLNGTLQQTIFNITSPSTDLSTMKIRINVSVNNTGYQNFTNYTIKAVASSGEEIKIESVEPIEKEYVFFRNLYAGFETGSYELNVKFKAEYWNSSSYVLVNNIELNSTVGAVLEKSYEVETYAVAGDSLDNDGDCSGNRTNAPDCTPQQGTIGICIDEEENNNKDDDCDGKIDEDLEGMNYFEWCGNGFCAGSEVYNCFEDCATGYCGDNVCSSTETYMCVEDCGGTNCTPLNTCAGDGSAYFCNNWGTLEPANWCQSQCNSDNCWACSTEECVSKGCTLGSEGQNSWCYKLEVCGDNSCPACTSFSACDATSSCQWEVDSYSPNGGWCERPWNCDNECAACMDQSSCDASTATMGESGCAWKVEGLGSWCQWNMSYAPPSGGMGGIIENLWVDSNFSKGDYQALEDWQCYSDYCGVENQAGNYYIMLSMGTTNVDIKVNGAYFATINNSNGNWGKKWTNTTYAFSNGTYLIEIFDKIGPDYVAWNVTFGDQTGIGNIIINTMGNSSSNKIADAYNESGKEVCDGEGNCYLVTGVGISGNYYVTVELYQGDSINVTVKDSNNNQNIYALNSIPRHGYYSTPAISFQNNKQYIIYVQDNVNTGVEQFWAVGVGSWVSSPFRYNLMPISASPMCVENGSVATVEYAITNTAYKDSLFNVTYAFNTTTGINTYDQLVTSVDYGMPPNFLATQFYNLNIWSAGSSYKLNVTVRNSENPSVNQNYTWIINAEASCP
ncbi:MAG: hypothetical protein V1859_10890 [archaeon]